MFSRKMLVLRAVPRDISTRALSTSTARLFATPTDHHPRKETRQVPVDDIDVVFDYPSETQTAHQKIPLEDAGLDLHSAIPHGPKAGTPGAGKMKGVGTSESHFMYYGLGALGLGALYMMMRRKGDANQMSTNPPMKGADAKIMESRR